MHPLTSYYIHQAGGGGGIGPIYSLPHSFKVDTESAIIWGLYFGCLNLCSSKAQRPAPRYWGVQPCRQRVTFFPPLPTTLRDIKRSFLSTFGRLYLLRWRVAVAANADIPITHQTPHAKRRKRTSSTRRKPSGKTAKRKRGVGTKSRPPIKRDIFA